MRAFGEFRILLLSVSILWGTPVVLWGEEHRTNGTVAASTPRSSSLAHGRLETTRLVLEQSEETVSFLPKDLNQPQWHFPGMDSEAVFAFLKSAGLTGTQLEALKRPEVAIGGPHGLIVVPPRHVGLGLTRASRRVIYDKLAEFPENERERQPFQFLETDVDEWRDSGVLSEQTTDLVKRMSVVRAGMLCFSDTQIASEVPFYERGPLLRMLTRVPSLAVKLTVDRQSDIEAMSSYWGAGGRTGEVRAVLAAMGEVEGGSKMDLSRILPPFARSRLYTFPDSSMQPTAPFQDCFWTALNFFRETPEEFNGDTAKVSALIAQRYSLVRDAPKFGDVVMMMDPGGTALHACVYLADNIVFTKNGKGLNRPWILMDMDEMFRTYLAHLRPGIRLQVLAYRLNGT